MSNSVPFKWEFYDYYGMRIHVSEDGTMMIFQIRKEDTHKERIYNMWACVHPIYRSVLDHGGISLHAGMVGRNEMCVLVAAPGGVGKSTTCSRFPKSWVVHGDDEVIVIGNENGELIAYPFPTWSNFLIGKEPKRWHVTRGFAVKAIYFLYHSKINSVKQMSESKSAVLINQSARQIVRRGWELSGEEKKKALQKKVIDAAVRMAKSASCFELHLSQDEPFDDLIESSLNG